MLFSFALTILLHAPAFDTQVANPSQIHFYYLQDGKNIRTLEQVAALDPRVVYATNIQMFAISQPGRRLTPVGLYMEEGKQVSKLRKVNDPRSNFGMQPQCVFALTKAGKAVMTPVDRLQLSDYRYAVQLAPMLVVDGHINPRLTKSGSRYIRNAVGIKANGQVVFAMSREPVTFQELAQYFLGMGCVNASYVDGVVSKTWRKGTGQASYHEEFAVMAGVYAN